MLRGSEMAVVDANAAALGVSQKQLMESSGNAVAAAIRGLTDAGADVHVFAGRGNNGGDAFAAVRFLRDCEVTVSLLGRPDAISTTIARENFDALLDTDIRTITDSTDIEIGDTDLLVDAMLGTGIRGELREPEATAAQAMNDASAPVLSVDVPSGLDAETGSLAATAVEADHVVTFHDTKPGLADLEANVDVADIGIPAAAENQVGPGDLLRLSRDPNSHKGDHGEVLVIGGGPYAGAPALTAQAALRAGADLVRVACPAAVAHEIQGYSEDLIVRRVDGYKLTPQDVGPIMELAGSHDVVVIGPGLGDDDDTLEAVEAILEAFDGRAVVDADALQVVPRVDTAATILCTPHQGELVEMGGRTAADWEERTPLVEDFAKELGHALLVKGPRDVISDGDTTRTSVTGNPGMTVGGTGDVLAGIAGALLVHQSPIHAGGIGAFANGRAGDRVVDDRGYGLVASDLLDVIPRVLWGERP
ncbi:MAG: NAD(P)H-hydrate dehydratase [Salinirussus sp.]